MLPLEETLELASPGSGLIKGSTAVPLTRNANRVYVVYQLLSPGDNDVFQSRSFNL